MSVIHIGQPKAASSSLQRALWDHREALAAGGVIYPDTAARNHNPVVAEYVLNRGVGQGNTRFGLELQRLAADGEWEPFLRQIRGQENVIVSSEFLVHMPPGLIVDLLNELDIVEPTILFSVRRASRSLASQYSQMAKTAGTLRFEIWARSFIAQTLAGSGQNSYLDVRAVEERWGAVGTVRTVLFDSSSFEAEVIDVLGIDGLVPRPFLEVKNAAPCAARCEAFQVLFREGWSLDRKLLHDITDHDPIVDSLPGRGGRFALVPDVADLLDAAYPVDAAVDAESVRALRRRLERPEPFTTTGLSDEQWDEAVSVCVADLRERIR